MKKTNLQILFVALLSVTMLAGCGDGYKTTESGLNYKFITVNKDAQQVQIGDVLVGTCTVKLGDSVVATVSQPDRILMAGQPAFEGDLPEGLLMMHIGDEAIFAIEADSLKARGVNFPDFYKEGTGMKIVYQIKLDGIITQQELMQEQNNYVENLQQQKEEEKMLIANYVKDNKIKAEPTEDGLYIIVNKKGNGQKVEIGREVAINYTGRLLDGRVFDSSVESVAKENNIYDGNRNYSPLTYVVGKTSLIEGWEKGVINQPAGSKLTLIVPSTMGYGSRDMGMIPPNSTLIFDIDIVSVK